MLKAIEVPVDPHQAGIDTIRQAIHEARAALAGVLGAAGVDSTKTRETARALNVNRGLVWRVSRVVGAMDDVTVATHLPGPVGVEKLLSACVVKGVPSELIEQARSSVYAFHRAADRLALDRKTLEILLANAGGRVSTSADLEGARRSLFEGACAVWGVRADMRLRCTFLAPSQTHPGMIDEGDVAGYVGFRRLRPVPWPMSYKTVYKDDGSTQQSWIEEAIDDSSSGASLPLIREFCSPSNIMIHAKQTQRATRHELPVVGDLGSESTTCVFGSLFRGLWPDHATVDCKEIGGLVVLDTPVERVMFDVFLHRALKIEGPLRVLLADRLTHPHGYSAAEIESEAIPVEVFARPLGPGSAGAVTPHVPWYPRLVEKMCARMGRRPDEFQAYRIELAYPPIPTSLVVRQFLGGV